MRLKVLVLSVLLTALTVGQNYQGSQNCQLCHTGSLRTFPGFSAWQATLHTTIHLPISAANMRGRYTDTVSMGSAYGNAKAAFRISGNDYFVKLIPSSGTPVEYQLVWTYGFNWKQRYLVKIENSYYMPPVQWNLKGYKDNTSGAWANYNPQNWFNADGTLKPVNNTLRTKSWDKNCAGCHVVPGNKTNSVQKVITGADTAWVYNWANNNSAMNMVIGCESCHGYPTSSAGAGHVKKLTDLSYDRKIEVCAQCHMRGYSKFKTYEYPYNDSTGVTYPVGNALIDYVTIAPGLWADGKSAKQHHQQWHDMKLSKHYNQSLGMTCVTCHDPHQNTAQKFQLKEDFNSLTVGVGCVKCHANKATATNGINDHSKHAQTISQCASCHMTHNAKTANDYDISNHSFMPIRPNATRTYSGVTGGMINTCAVSCHRNGKGTRGTGKNFGITDASLTNWAEATDIQLADTLWKYYQTMYGVSDVKMLSADFPASFNLLQNYPNPFNPTTKIRFEVPSIANVKIEIYNVSGELINVLINRQLTAGSYNVEWDGKSVYGIGVPSGVYIYRMVANNNFSAAKKMLLTK